MKRINKKVSLTLFLVIVLALSQVFSIVYADPFSESSTRLYVDGQLINIPESLGKPFTSDGRTFLPIRATASALGVRVEWRQDEKTVLFNYAIKLKLDSDIIETLSGNQKMDVKVFAINGRVYVPIRFVSEILGYKVAWDTKDGYSNVYITAGGGTVPSDGSGIKEEGNMIIVDTSKYISPTYNDGYSQIDIYWGKVGFNELSNVGTRTSDTTLKEDVEHFNNTIMKNTLMNFSDLGYLDFFGDGNSFFDAPLRVFRDKDNNPVIAISDWGLYVADHQSRRLMAIMNATAEILRYYTGKDADAKAIWAFVDSKFKTKEDIDCSKDYLFGETKVIFEDPGHYGIRVIILND